MNFASVKSITIPEGSVYQIISGSTILWSKGTSPTPPGPSIILPPDNQVWYEASSKITANIGSPISHSYDSETGRGVLEYENSIIRSSDVSYNAFRQNYYLTKIWWPNSCTAWQNDCMHSCPELKEIYAGQDLQAISNGTCNNGTTPNHITLVNNNYFYENNTGLVLKSNNVLLLGTYNLDIRNTPCTTLGNRCMADMNLRDAVLYFPDTMTGASGDWYIGSSTTTIPYTIYLLCSQAPNWNLNYIRGAITWHIPAVNSGYENWKSKSGWTVIEDL